MRKGNATLSLKQMILLGLYLLAAAGFTVIYFTLNQENPPASMERLSMFEATRPFQYRLLVPALAHAIVHVLPITPIRELFMVLTVLIVFGTFILGVRYHSAFMSPGMAHAATFALFYALLWNHGLQGMFLYVSDLAAVLACLAVLLALQHRHLRAYYVLFFLATLNRETSCFLTLAFLLTPWHPRPPLRFYLGHATAQAMIWLGIKLLLSRLFAGQGGSLFDFRLFDNLEYLAIPTTLGLARTLTVFGSLWILIPFGLAASPPFMRRMLWIIPPFTAGMLVVANIWEIRVFAELIPIVAGPAVIGLQRLTREASW